MMNNLFLFSTLYALIEYIKYLTIYLGISHAKPVKKVSSYVWSFSIALVLINLMVLLHGKEHISTAVILTGVIIPLMCLKDKKAKIIIVYSVLSIAVYIIDSYILTLSMLYADGDLGYMMESNTIFIMNVLLTLPIALLILVIGLMNKKDDFVPEDFKEVLPQYILMLVGAICCYSIVFTTQRIFYNVVSELELRSTFITTTGACIIFFLIGVWQLRITTSRNFYKKKDLFQQEYIEVQDNYFNEILNKEQQLRGFRHDLRSHMIAIQDMGSRRDFDSLQEYTQRMLNQMEQLKRYNFSGNYVVDAVVSDILQRAEQENISVEWKGHLPADIDIERYDLCIVISNLVKNAVEACIKISNYNERYIYVNASTFENIFSIEIKNPIVEPVKMNKGKPVTSKENPSFHGFGTQNIEKIVKKYNGSINYLVQNNTFGVEIVMHQNRKI